MRVRRIVAALLVAVLVSPTVWAGDLRKAAERDGALMARQESSRWSRIPPVYKWSGVGLIGLGVADIVLGLAFRGETSGSYRACPLWDWDCESSNGVIVQGAAFAGAGAALILIGASKASSTAPSITPTRGGFMVRKKITF